MSTAEILREGITQLHKDVTRCREHGYEADKITMHLDQFSWTWCQEFEQSERDEINGNKNAIRYVATELQWQQKDKAIKQGREPADAYRTAESAPDPSRLADMWISDMTKMTSRRYAELRSELTRAVDDIREGRKPNLSLQNEHQFYAGGQANLNLHMSRLIDLFIQGPDKQRENSRER